MDKLTKMEVIMKEELYLNKMKNKLNHDSSDKYIFDESQTGPQEEPILVEYEVDVEKFKRYLEKNKKQ